MRALPRETGGESAVCTAFPQRSSGKPAWCPERRGCFQKVSPGLCAVGPRLGNSPVPSIVQCLARKDGTDDFYQLKVSDVPEAGRPGPPGPSCRPPAPLLPLHTHTARLLRVREVSLRAGPI